jgi:hypothetical protein
MPDAGAEAGAAAIEEFQDRSLSSATPDLIFERKRCRVIAPAH